MSSSILSSMFMVIVCILTNVNDACCCYFILRSQIILFLLPSVVIQLQLFRMIFPLNTQCVSCICYFIQSLFTYTSSMINDEYDN